jgi:hypothetical protein
MQCRDAAYAGLTAYEGEIGFDQKWIDGNVHEVVKRRDGL